MSKIPSGLLGSTMRARMEDKATIKHIGGLYVGGSDSVTYSGGDDTASGSTSAREVEELYPAGYGLPLVSNGAGQVPSFQTLGTAGITNQSVMRGNLGEGTVVLPLDNQRGIALNISGNEDSIDITFLTK